MDKSKFSFSTDYLNYFKEKAEKSSSTVPGLEAFEYFFEHLGVQEQDKVLDCGCSYGRLFPILAKHSSNIYGIDLDMQVINDATKYDYASINIGTAENSNLPSDYFDKTVMFGVFDITEQEEALYEQNRILKKGGDILITGKNYWYHEDDQEAFIAERNAFLKKFPNHFTRVKELVDNSDKFGFEVINLFLFERRGDFAQIKFANQDNVDKPFYEYCVILRKVANANKNQDAICQTSSLNAIKKTEESEFGSIEDFFESHMKNEG